MKTNKINRVITMALITAVMMVTSCKKDETVTKTKTVLLTQHGWKFSAATPDTDPLVQFLAQLLLNSTFTFKTDGTYSATLFTGSDSGTWAFQDSEGSLVFDPGTADETKYSLIKLDETNLELQQTDGTTTLTLKFVKQ